MKAKFTIVLLSILPFLANACSCIYIESFCEAITPQSNVSAVRIIEKFTSTDSFSMNTYLVVEKIEDLIGNKSKDTMTILAGSGTSCDPNYYNLKSGDSLVVNVEASTFMVGNIPYDTDLGYTCSRKFLPIKNDKIHDGISDSFEDTIDYSDFKSNIVDCSKLSILDNPKILDRFLFIYPNPANDILNIGLNFSTNYNYQIYDVGGRLISEGQAIDRRHEIDLLTLQKGVYFIKVFVNESFAIRKFVKL